MRKTDYTPRGPQEIFIVPLLEKEILHALRLIDRMLDNPSGYAKKALDCGCGNQPFKGHIQELGFTYESLDVEQNCLANVDYICSLDAAAPCFNNIITDQYCLTLVTEVLEHVKDLPRALDNLFSITAEGGYVLLTAPFFYPLHEEPFDFYRPTIHAIRALASDAGFEIQMLRKAGCSVDIMGTLLGASRIRFDSPRSLIDKVLNRILLLLQKLLWHFLVRHYHKLTSDNNGLYLSNVVILKRPG